MEYFIGVSLALGIAIFASVVGFDRDRSFYPVVMVVIAMTYGLFAVMGGSVAALMNELIWIVGFVLVSVFGFKRNLWLIVAALSLHGIFDFFHGHLIHNPGVPSWWPMFCLTYDLTAAAYLAAILWRSNKSRSYQQ
jgi:hypothetical protein